MHYMYQNFLYELITWNLLPQRKNMNHEKHVIHEEVFTYVNILPKYLSNMPEIINKITYIVYKEWSVHALMNEIKENNYDVNILWKGNIACPGYWKMILFWRLRVTLILVDHETGCVGKVISLVFHVYKEHPNWKSYVSYVSYASILRQGDHGLWIGNKHEK
jgi:hypothetical protein